MLWNPLALVFLYNWNSTVFSGRFERKSQRGHERTSMFYAGNYLHPGQSGSYVRYMFKVTISSIHGWVFSYVS